MLNEQKNSTSVNVALNKPAYVQDPYRPGNDRYDASNAVDGRKSDLSVRVNLGSIHSIHHITIYFRTDNNLREFYVLAKYILGFSVYVSNTTDRLQGTLCYKDDNFTILTIPVVFTTTCAVHGQYIIYYNERLTGMNFPRGYTDYVISDLCKWEVYACDQGSFGGDCSETCGHCRDIDQCSVINGTCLTGCVAGYQRGVCKSPCQYGFFGPDCADRCYDTCDGCNNINGSCDFGCKPGWQGYECQDVNVAFNKPAYMHSNWDGDTYDASNVVDGRKSDLTWHGGQCAVSYDTRTATWWVNMTSIHSIHHITIYFSIKKEPWGPSNDRTRFPLGFSVYVSNTTDRLQGTLCYKDNNFTRATIPAVFTTTCPVHGQYVIFYNEREPGVTYPDEYSDYVNSDLCEVEVYGECSLFLEVSLE
uniref:Scavenger receptor class F member 2 n=1 Tax=Magallana gigas TaxID=29159 RepID=K1PUW9_MAGGI